MSSPRELLALRKEMLLARTSLQRLKIGRELDTLRDSLRWQRAAATIVASPQGRRAAAGLLLLVARGGRMARMAGLMAGALALAKLAGAASRFSRDRSARRAATLRAPSRDRG